MGRLVAPKLEDGHLFLAVGPNDVLEARWIVVKERRRPEDMPNELIPPSFTGDEGSEEAEGHGRSLSARVRFDRQRPKGATTSLKGRS